MTDPYKKRLAQCSGVGRVGQRFALTPERCSTINVPNERIFGNGPVLSRRHPFLRGSHKSRLLMLFPRISPR